MEALSERTLAVSVLRTYSDRVRDKLLGVEFEWMHVPASDDGLSRKRTRSGSCRVIPTRLLKGGRKNRRGFALLVLEGVTISLDALSPIVRQNISAAMQLTHRIPAATVSEIGSKIWSFIVEQGFDASKHILRVECFPKEETETVCLGLQKAAAGDSEFRKSSM